MRTRLLALSLLVTVLVFGQTDHTIEEISESESKSALAVTNFRSNTNTGNYDLTYHRLEFTLDPSISFINGDVTSYFIAKEDLSQITFDLDDNLTVSEVTQIGNSLSFTQNSNDELIITLPQIQNQGVLDSLTVSYSGTPVSSGFGTFVQSTHDGDPIIWTLSEPYSAKGWWPCKQDLIDKIDEIDVYITTPQFNPSNEEYIAVSNGMEQSQVVNGTNKTTHYNHQHPIPAYLIAIAVTNYEVYTDEVPNNGNPFDVVNYVFPESLVTAQSSTPFTVDVMDLFINLFEEYPYSDEKYGHAQFGWGGGMEHTTVSFMGNFSQNLIAHELAHQWFGNKITCGSWKDIWLNEGFATYLSGLVVEAFEEASDFSDWKQNRVNSITSQPGGYVYLQDQDTINVSRIFNGRLTYSKGAMVLHMLRKKLGDTDFYQGVQDYLSHPDHAYGYAKTEDFIPIMEQASGLDLTEFFNDWLFDQGYPSYTVEWSQISSTQVQFVLSQTQSHNSVSYFEAPVPVRVIGTGGEIEDFILDNSINDEVFIRNVNFDIAAVEFDPNSDLISKNNQVLLSDEVFSLNEALLIFPNPTSTELYVSKPTDLLITEIKIFNMIGQMVVGENYSGAIKVGQLLAGMHFIRFETDQGPIHKSFIKK